MNKVPTLSESCREIEIIRAECMKKILKTPRVLTDIAVEIGISLPTLTIFLDGKKKSMRWDTLYKLERWLTDQKTTD